MSQKLIFIAGSPSQTSRSSRILDAVRTQLQTDGVETRAYSLANFDPEAILHGDTTNPTVREFIEQVQGSNGIAVATPVYKGTFAGSLKVILDVIPPDALKHGVALGIATARLPGHLQGAGQGLQGIFDFFQVRARVTPVLLADEVLSDPLDGSALSEQALRAAREAASRVLALLD